jgi:hypothetical protein
MDFDLRTTAIVIDFFVLLPGQLWYRLDNQQGDNSLLESASLAWALAPNDVEGSIVCS